MEHDTTMGQVLPFARDAEYLRRLAAKRRERGKPIAALELLRLSAAKAPGEARTIMEIAETYAEMQCPTLSNRALFSLLGDESFAPECFYGAGCNFYATQLLECARDCLVMYLQKRPTGAFVHEAVEMIESIDSETDTEQTLDGRVNRRIGRVLNCLDAGKPRLAARQVRRALSMDRRNGGTHALRAFALLAAQDAEAALEAARYAMRLNRDDIRAVCAMASALMANGSADAARAFLERAVKRIENEDDIQLVCQTACDMGEHASVRTVLKRLETEAPYSDEALHLLAAASFNVGDVDEAMRCWRLLRRIDPMDTVAEYLLKRAEEKTLQAPVTYLRQVPLSETLARLSRLREWVQEGAKAIEERWNDGDGLEKLLRWGITSDEQGIPQAMLGILATIGDARAQAVLTDLLCDMNALDALKHSALAALCVMGNEGPFYALIRGRLTLVHVSRVDSRENDPHTEALVTSVKRRLGTLSTAEEERVRLLCGLSAKQDGVSGSGQRAHAVELAFRRMRGETATPMERSLGRRKMERCVRRIMKEAENELHQL